MQQSFKENRIGATIKKQDPLAKDIYRMVLSCGTIPKDARPGQFVSLYTDDVSRLLPRPISICDMDAEKGEITLVYRVAGEGTRQFSRLKEGDAIDVMGPLGKGFPIEDADRVILLGGGIGIPPMVALGKAFAKAGARVMQVAGYRDKDLFLTEELKSGGELFIATDDGSVGTKGTVIDALRENGLEADLICACGPTPMLKAVKAYAEEKGIRCYLSLEERMACGVGACLGCVCKTAEVDSHSMVKNKRVCKDGPVFLSTEIVFE